MWITNNYYSSGENVQCSRHGRVYYSGSDSVVVTLFYKLLLLLLLFTIVRIIIWRRDAA